MNQKGLVPILIALVLAGVILFAPLPRYQKATCLEMYPVKCSPASWKLGPSLWDAFTGKTTQTVQYSIPSPSPSPAAILINRSITWDVPISTISINDEQKLKDAISRINLNLPENIYLSIIDARIEGKWGLLTGGPKATQSQTLIPTEPFLWLTQRTQDGWEIIRPEDSNFCQILKSIPERLLDADSKAFFINCYQ